MKFKQVKTLAKICLFSFVIFAAGGLLDTVAAMRSGFFSIWGTELCEKQRAMWKTLTNTPIYPDTLVTSQTHIALPTSNPVNPAPITPVTVSTTDLTAMAETAIPDGCLPAKWR